MADGITKDNRADGKGIETERNKCYNIDTIRKVKKVKSMADGTKKNTRTIVRDGKMTVSILGADGTAIKSGVVDFPHYVKELNEETQQWETKRLTRKQTEKMVLKMLEPQQ